MESDGHEGFVESPRAGMREEVLGDSEVQEQLVEFSEAEKRDRV